jgi:hypothetical protein
LRRALKLGSRSRGSFGWSAPTAELDEKLAAIINLVLGRIDRKEVEYAGLNIERDP